ncbi:ribonuclease HII [Clostridiales bacterium]|nr:ribonuclease HII [Clostridiales bacterium]
MLDLSFEDAYRTEGKNLICGIDEAGRGPLAGPVVAGACILPEGLIILGLDDSKKLSEKKRERLYDEICQNALSWSVGMASPEEIDTYNILEATLLAMRRAVSSLSAEPDFLLIDGNISRGFSQSARAVVGGDGICQSIAAASILAKVTRDRLCAELDYTYPQYGFAKHKGYPTKAHKLAVYEHGPCPVHRKSFLTFLERDKSKLEAWHLEKQAAE